MVKENYDKQHLRNLMQPRLSYDGRVNWWMQSQKRVGCSGVTSVVGVLGFSNSVLPAGYAMFFWWISHEVWKQEKHPFQAYMKWRKIHMDQRAREAEQEED